MSCVLIGAPGAGKSTVAPLVGALLGLPVADTDEMVAARTGRSVADCFIELGESAFREVERALACEALAGEESVIALGSGAVSSPEVEAALMGHDVVWLQVDVAHAAKRSGLDVARPAQLGNVRGMFLRMLKERAHLYSALASRVVDTAGKTPDEIAAEIAAGTGTS